MSGPQVRRSAARSVHGGAAPQGGRDESAVGGAARGNGQSGVCSKAGCATKSQPIRSIRSASASASITAGSEEKARGAYRWHFGEFAAGSFNTALLRAAAEVAPAGVTIDVRTIHGIPLYDADVENGPGIPQAVDETKGRDRVVRRGAARHARSTTTRFQACSRTPSTGCRGPMRTSRASFAAGPSRIIGASAGAVRNHAVPGGVAAGDPHLGHAAVAGRATTRVRGAESVRPGRQACGSAHARANGEVRQGLLRFRRRQRSVSKYLTGREALARPRGTDE